MSLVLIAHDDELGIICSDGRVSRIEANGSRTIVKEDSPKFTVLTENLVMAATGRADLCDVVQNAALKYVNQLPSQAVRFAALAGFLPIMAQHAFREYPIKGPEVELSLALVGLDSNAGKIRCVSWISREGFQLTEGTHKINLYAFGDSELVHCAVDKLTAMVKTEEGRTEKSISSIMHSIVVSLAESHEGINNISLGLTLGP